MYKEDLALNNLQWLICRKILPNQTTAEKDEQMPAQRLEKVDYTRKVELFSSELSQCQVKLWLVMFVILLYALELYGLMKNILYTYTLSYGCLFVCFFKF